MGVCCTKTNFNDLDDDEPKNHKDEVLFMIRNNLKDLEEYIVKLRKEDVHYKMTRLIFMLNCIKDLVPLIKKIEDSSDHFNFSSLKTKFEEVFRAIWRNDREKCVNSILDIEEFFKINQIPQKMLATPQ